MWLRSLLVLISLIVPLNGNSEPLPIMNPPTADLYPGIELMRQWWFVLVHTPTDMVIIFGLIMAWIFYLFGSKSMVEGTANVLFYVMDLMLVPSIVKLALVVAHG
jgi:hypothetical protein